MNPPKLPKIFAVVVTYEPDEELLSQLLQTLAPQVTGGVVINNGDSLSLPDGQVGDAGFVVKHLQANAGVATALNAGFEWASHQAAEFVITFDQDSEPAADMVARLLAAYRESTAAGEKVGAIGPQQVDRRSGRRAPFLAPIATGRHRLIPQDGVAVEVDHLITSGCLVPMAAWADAGKFRDELFIDYVDIEWSLRLRHRGWKLLGLGGAILTHSIGDDIKHWWGMQFSVHSPLRHYFLLRNGIFLQSLPHISRVWKMFDLLQLFKKLIVFTLVGRPRSAHLKAMLKGIQDGMRGRMGPARSIE